MLEFFKEYSIFLQTLMTFILILITGWYTYLTRKLLLSSRESQRPYVFVDFQGSGLTYIEILIENTGFKAAQDVSFKILKDIKDREGTFLSEYLPIKNGFSFIPPQRSYKYRFFTDIDFFKSKQNTIIKISVNYKDDAKLFSDNFIIDLSPFQSVLFSSFKDPVDGVTSELSKIRSEINNNPLNESFISRFNNNKKNCQFCYEKINENAIKCPHCGEFQELKKNGNEK